MAPLALEQIAEEISEQKRRGYRHRRVAFEECRSKGVLTSIATGFIGFSSGFAIQVAGRNIWPGFIQRFHLIPILASAFVPVWTFIHLLKECENQYKMKLRYTKHSEDDSMDDIVLS
ncbi:hypothetical protein LSH36_307g02039 [Paralvinella palmiformis]|uniref:Transmembrane protein n=1 Tax=Paralvinella palmiformis TaxID=53620 RepID=A0AAD9N0Y3_9ANNE|nr:hypothetical protein LSH36_307g02039 [Paralvinella palmiformis]